MTQIDPSQHGIHTLEELGAAEGAHILIAGEDGQGNLNLMLRSWLHVSSTTHQSFFQNLISSICFNRILANLG